MKLRELINETTTSGAVAVGPVESTGRLIKRQQEDISHDENNFDGLKVWEVYINNNYFDGDSVDYGSRPYPVVAHSEEEAKELILKNSDEVLNDILSRKFASGNPVLPENTAVEITEKEIEKIEDSTEKHKRTTFSPETMLTPDGFMGVVLDNGNVKDISTIVNENLKFADSVLIKSKKSSGKVRAILGESVVVRTNNDRVRIHMNDIELLQEDATMRLKDIADVRTDFEDADFWIQRKGSKKTVGTPIKSYSPEHIGVKVTGTDVVIPDYLFYAIQYLHSKGYFQELARGTTNLQHIKTDDVKNIALSQPVEEEITLHGNEFFEQFGWLPMPEESELLDEADTKTKTKTQTPFDRNLDDLLNPRTDTLPSKVDDKEDAEQSVSVKKASAADTMRAVQGITPTAQMRDLLNRMQDIEMDDDDIDVGYYDVPDVTTDTLPAVVSKELKTHGVQSPDFHQVSSLPGNASQAIRYIGKKLFSMATKTPTEDIYMIGDLSGMGPNSHEEINAMAGWITSNGVPVTGMSDIDFGGVLPGYHAEYQMYTAGGVRWMLIQDYIDDQYMGKYIFMWPEQDSIDVWSKKNLKKDDNKVLESIKVNEKSRFGLCLLGGVDFLSEQGSTIKSAVPVTEGKSKYQGREVTLNKPIRSKDGPKKFHVYVKNDKGNVIKVNFGDPDMEIKRDNPERRKSFRARHKCDQKKDKTTAGYWSCKMW